VKYWKFTNMDCNGIPQDIEKGEIISSSWGNLHCPDCLNETFNIFEDFEDRVMFQCLKCQTIIHKLNS